MPDELPLDEEELGVEEEPEGDWEPASVELLELGEPGVLVLVLEAPGLLLPGVDELLPALGLLPEVAPKAPEDELLAPLLGELGLFCWLLALSGLAREPAVWASLELGADEPGAALELLGVELPETAELGLLLAVPALLLALEPGELAADVLASAGELAVLLDEAEGVLSDLALLSDDEDEEPAWPAAADEPDEPAPAEPADWAEATTVKDPTVRAAAARMASVLRDIMSVISQIG